MDALHKPIYASGRANKKPTPHCCPRCADQPKPLRYEHDKHNRAFNRLKWGIRRLCGASAARGYDRTEAVQLYNAIVDRVRAELAKEPQ